MGALEELLVVQTHDTRADQLRHQRAHLPELAQAATIRDEIAAIDAERSVVGGELGGIRSAEHRLEDEAATVQAKAADVERRLYDGSVTAHKELEDLQADHRSLVARQAQLEDEAIELMEQAEPLQARVDGLDDRRAALQGDLDSLQAVIDTTQAELDGLISVEAAARESAAQQVDAGVLRDYDSLRARLGGVGAARLEGSRCEGCHLEIPPAELDGVRRAPEDTTVFCPQCGRILVR